MGPATRPGARPGKSTGKPDTKGRQARVGKKMMAVLATVTAVGVIVGTAELALHGPAFFIFRQNGAGASETGITDSQFPGHPGAPAPAPAPTAPAPSAPSAQPSK